MRWLLVLCLVGCATASDPRLDIDAGPDACIAVEELCNDLDDDCDGKIDETFAMKGTGCELVIAR